MPRLFLAVPAVLDAYGAVRERFTPLAEGRWIPSGQLHLTLLFLGDRFEADDVIARVDAVTPSFTPSALQGLGYFKRNGILFARSVNPSLAELHRRLSAAFELPWRPLEPHVTLQRVKRLQRSREFAAALHEFDETPLGVLEPVLRLYDSTLHPEGARYRVVKEWRP